MKIKINLLTTYKLNICGILKLTHYFTKFAFIKLLKYLC